MATLVRLVLALMLVAAAASAALADKRVALVIGNSAYQHTAKLTNTRNDAADMIAVLERLGFDVIDGIDLDKRAMERLIRNFEQKLVGADIALFFYAGHGIQIGGQNHLLPVDARLLTEGDVDFESLPLHLVLSRMERTVKTALVLLDACRDNPLARNLARTMGTRAATVGQGLADVKTGIGTLISFSTQPGNVALDGDGRNSPYSSALLREIETPGRDILTTLAAVRGAVVTATRGKQVPWEHTSLLGPVVLKTEIVATPPVIPPLAGVPSYEQQAELALWATVRDSKNPAVIQSYIDRFPKGTFAGTAKALIAQLESAPKPAAVSANAAPPDKKPPEAGFQPAPPAAQRIAPPVQIAVGRVPAVPAPPPEPSPEQLARDIQTGLSRVGCYKHPVDGKWGANSSQALAEFARRTKMSLATDVPTRAAVDAVAGKQGRVCPKCSDDEQEENGRCVAKIVQATPKTKPDGSISASRANENKGSSTFGDNCRKYESCVKSIAPSGGSPGIGLQEFKAVGHCGGRPSGC